MTYEIDHVFVRASVDAPEADRLLRFGLVEGSSNIHQGQGTANRRFFFRNSMLELFWVSDPDEARGDTVRRTRLWDRWANQDRECSPFGICLRTARSGYGEPPFPTWEYRPPYVPGDQMIHVAEHNPLSEPMWFFLPFGRRPDVVEPSRREPFEHLTGVRELTRIHVVAPCLDQFSSTAQAVINTGLVSMTPGQEHLLQLTFDGDRSGEHEDFRPELPIVFHW